MPLPTVRPVAPQPSPQVRPLPVAPVAPPSLTVIWKFIARYTINPNGINTAPLGDIPLPSQGLHAMVYWSAIDDTANTTGTLCGLQFGIGGGAIQTAANYVWTDFSNANGGAMTVGGNPTDVALRAFVTTGGGTGSVWRSNGRIYFENYSDPSQNQKAWWDTVQVNTGVAIRRSGSGFLATAAGQGPLTKLRFSSGAGNLVAGTFFELWVAMLG